MKKMTLVLVLSVFAVNMHAVTGQEEKRDLVGGKGGSSCAPRVRQGQR